MMKRYSLILFLVLFSAFILASCNKQEEKIILKFTPKVGATYHTSVVVDQDIVETMSGKETHINQTIGFGFSIVPTEVDKDQNVWIDISYDWVQYKQSSPQGVIEYDSQKPTDKVNPLVIGFDALVGKGWSANVSPSGAILDISGMDKFISDITDAIAAKGGAQSALLQEQMKKQYNRDTLVEEASKLVFSFPDGGIKKGDTWTTSTEATVLIPLKLDTTYSLIDCQDNVATLSMKSAINNKKEEYTTEIGGITVRYNISGTQEGTTKLDTTTGLPMSADVTQTVSGYMVMVMGGQEIKVPVSINSTSKIETRGE